MKFSQLWMVSVAATVALPASAQTGSPSAPPVSPVSPVPQAQTRADVEAKVRERLSQFDADQNGTVTPDEMKAFADQRKKARADDSFAAMDADKNGSISRGEFDAWTKDRNFLNMPRIERFGGPGGKPWPKARVLRIEQRAIDRAAKMAGEGSAQSAPSAPSVDGKATLPPRVRVMMMGRNGAAWADGDGKGIVIADAVKKALERFDSADTDRDGKLSLEERKARREAWRSRRG